MSLNDYYKGKNVLITGASSGIGKLMALNIAKLGGNIINWDINLPTNELDDNVKSNGSDYKFYKIDLSDKNQIYNTAKKTLSDFKSINIIINCAGIVSGGYIQELSDEKIKKTFAVNTFAPFYITKAFFENLKNTKDAKIVTISSAAGITATAKQTDYASSKAAAISFMDALRNEFNAQKIDIKTLVVCPYYIDTGMFEGVKTKVSFLLPILKQEYVAMKIVRTIVGKKKRLIMPRFASVSGLVRAFPVCISDSIVNLFGLNNSMNDFVGRTNKK